MAMETAMMMDTDLYNDGMGDVSLWETLRTVEISNGPDEGTTLLMGAIEAAAAVEDARKAWAIAATADARSDSMEAAVEASQRSARCAEAREAILREALHCADGGIAAAEDGIAAAEGEIAGAQEREARAREALASLRSAIADTEARSNDRDAMAARAASATAEVLELQSALRSERASVAALRASTSTVTLDLEARLKESKGRLLSLQEELSSRTTEAAADAVRRGGSNLPPHPPLIPHPAHFPPRTFPPCRRPPRVLRRSAWPEFASKPCREKRRRRCGLRQRQRGATGSVNWRSARRWPRPSCKRSAR